MKIGIDARFINETGVGRYIRNLIDGLGTVDKKNSYVVFLRRNALDTFIPPNARWETQLADIPWHSAAEQLFMPAIFNREHLDLLHVPYFNVPLLYFGKFIVTIHDLTILHFDTGKATTLPYVFYKLRRLGYYISLLKAIFWSQRVLAVSHTTKKEILEHFDVLPEHIVVIHEGADKS
jgi:tRNA U55 pseudouridine synthase TruB